MTARTIDDPEVVRRVQAYQDALESGESPDREALLSEFPEIAADLGACLDGLELVHRVAPQLRAEPEAGFEPEPLGDFRIVAEIGRGGMGVVYEAEQLSLGRRVALKVLPFASVLDPRHLARFKNEAQAAAQLNHPHIVPVYGVGCERGVHYYAMQRIEGITLSGVIRELRAAATNGGRPSLPVSP